MDLYGYAGNSPSNFTDPSGNSNSAIHIAETYLGGRDAGLGVGTALNLAIQSALVDIGTQGLGAADTNIHAMSGTLGDGSYQTPDQAFQGAASVVDARDQVDANDHYIDPFAIHTIADSYSGSHNYQPDFHWYTGIIPEHMWVTRLITRRQETRLHNM